MQRRLECEIIPMGFSYTVTSKLLYLRFRDLDKIICFAVPNDWLYLTRQGLENLILTSINTVKGETNERTSSSNDS